MAGVSILPPEGLGDFGILWSRNKTLITADILECAPLLQDLKTEFTEQIEIVNKDLFTLPKLAFQDNQDGGSRVEILFRGVSKAEWTDGRYCVWCNITEKCVYNVIYVCAMVLYFIPQNCSFHCFLLETSFVYVYLMCTVTLVHFCVYMFCLLVVGFSILYNMCIMSLLSFSSLQFGNLAIL